MSEESEKLRHKQYVAERKLTAAKHKEKRLQNEQKRLTFIFQSEAVQKKLNLPIERRRETLEADEGEKPWRRQGRN